MLEAPPTLCGPSSRREVGFQLAVAFVLGVAFAAVVTSLVDDVIMQLVAAIVGKPDFSDLTFSVGDGEIRYGAFLTALVTFRSDHRLRALPARQGGPEGNASQGHRTRLPPLRVLDPYWREHLPVLHEGRPARDVGGTVAPLPTPRSRTRR
jgi:hypothetical protein